MKFTSPVDLAFSIAALLKAQYDTESGEALLTGNVQHSNEYRLFVGKLGLPEASQLPTFLGDVVLDSKRKSLKKVWQQKKKELLANVN